MAGYGTWEGGQPLSISVGTGYVPHATESSRHVYHV